MGDKQQITIIEQEDLVPAYEHSGYTSDMLKLLNSMSFYYAKKVAQWDKVLYEEKLPYWKEPTTKQSKGRRSQNWKNAYYATQYSMGPRKLNKMLNLGEIASGDTSDGTQPKGKQNGKK